MRTYCGEADVDAAWPWYLDPETVRLVDGQDAQPYTREQVRSMYEALASQGQVFMIEHRTPEGWQPIGDVTLAPHTLPIVLRTPSRGHGVGSSVLTTLIGRARSLGWEELQVREVYPDNSASLALFKGLGFETNASPPPAMRLHLRDS